MKNENDPFTGIWDVDISDLISSEPMTLRDEVELIISDEHSEKKSNQLVRNSKRGNEWFHGIPWYPKLRKLLSKAYRDGTSIAELATAFQRTEKSIRMQLEHLGFSLDYVDTNRPEIQTLPPMSVSDNPSIGFEAMPTKRVSSKSFGDQIQELYG